MATRLKRKLGYEDYTRLPTDDGKRYEVLDGELYVTPAPSPLHQRLSKRLRRRLEDYFETLGLGEVFNAPIDVSSRSTTSSSPISSSSPSPARSRYAPSRACRSSSSRYSSPSTRAQDRGIKMRRYGELGIPHDWIVDPDAQTIECRRREGREYRLIAEAVVPDVLRHADWPDLEIDLAAIWR